MVRRIKEGRGLVKERGKIETKSKSHIFYPRDVLQVIVGASILAIPVGYTEETWHLGETLPLPNVLGFLIISILFIAAFTYYNYYRHSFRKHQNEFYKRVVVTYIFSFIIVAIILTLIQKAPWQMDYLLAFKRVIIVSFPASMSAAIADIVK